MKLPRDVSGRQRVAALRKLGYVETRQKGSYKRVTTQRDGEHQGCVRRRPEVLQRKDK
jgi:predicted RNA binding protein YcfA (HicA-like mRNA interferase family)